MVVVLGGLSGFGLLYLQTLNHVAALDRARENFPQNGLLG
jgi:hypothetical protein